MTDKFNDMMADHVMSNIDLITQTLHDGKSQAEINQIFAASHADLQQQIQAMLGNDALTQYNDYTQNLGANLTAKQFAANLTGDDAAKQEKEDQLRQLVLQSTATALSNAGLPPNYQIVPTLNFANIASEDQGNQSLDLLDTIFSNVVAGSSAFLSPEEQASLQTFRTNAINNNRMGLILNRKLMSPLSQQP